uniref:Integrase catalytic domain-containing protein n=1 Tax=Tanacetum cinerariifolium TaxID=118510 RepID=A0A6L2MFC0_TANCI|nr:hypothetical protein [Tanacetum cinerariifolium]
MKFKSAQNNTTAKLPILKLENGNSLVSVPQTTQKNGVSVTKMLVPVTAEEKTNKKNDVKAKSLLLMALLNEHQLTFIWMNKADIETISIDDLYNNFKIVEKDVKKSVGASTGAQNMAFMTAPSTSTTNDVNTTNLAYEASTVSPNVNTTSPQVSTANFSDNVVYAFMVENPNGSNLLQQDLEQIHKDDPEAMDLRWQLSLLSIRAKRYFQRIGKKIFINANDTTGAQRNQDGRFRNQDNTRKQGNNEDTSSKAMLAIDGVGFDWSDMAEEQVQTNMALIAFSDSKGKQQKDDKRFIDSRCSRHVTGNIAYLSDFKEFNGGYVAFGGGTHGGRISRKMCDKKNYVLFTDTGCLILSSNFKLPDESQILLKIPKKDNMYSMKNIVPKESLTCLDNLVRVLPLKHVENDQTCVACLKGKQHIATSKDETSEILKNFIKEIENLVDKKVKIIRCDNRTEFKNKVIDDFCREKGIKREYNVARTPQQNRVAERRNMTLIKATRTMLSDSKLPTTFWVEAVSTACYVQNKVLIVKPYNKTPYELFRGFKLALSFMRPFRCHVTILNTLDNLGKFNGKSDEGFFVGYSLSSKAYRVYNTRTEKVKENLHIRFFENKPMIEGNGPKWLFDIDSLTQSMNYVPVVACTISDEFACTQGDLNAGTSLGKEATSQDYTVMPIWKDASYFDSPLKDVGNDEPKSAFDDNEDDDKDKSEDDSSPKEVNVVGQHVNTSSLEVNTGRFELNTVDPSLNTASLFDPYSPTDMFKLGASDTLEATHVEFFSDRDAPEVDLENIPNSYRVSTTSHTRIHKDHPIKNAIGRTSAIQALEVWILMDLPYEKKAIRTKWVFRNKKDERGIMISNKARLVAKGHKQEEGINYKDVFAPVARIEAIRLFLTYASFMGFLVYKMYVKSAFLYGTIEEEVYVTQLLEFKDPDHPDKVYKVAKALYGLHQAPRAWYETLANYLLRNGFQRGKIDPTLFIKKQKGDILLVQVYVDDIIFRSTNKELCTVFEKLMKDKFQMSSMGELTFFLGLQKFNYTDVKSASTPVDLEKPLVKDRDANDVDVHLYRFVIGSLMYLTTSRPDIMFALCAYARFQVTPKTSHLLAVKRIFRYLKGKPNLGLWYSRDSPFELVAYTDSDYAEAAQDRKFTTGGCHFLGNKLISWQCKKQTLVATSTTKAKYVVAAREANYVYKRSRMDRITCYIKQKYLKSQSPRKSKEVEALRYLSLVVPLKKVVMRLSIRSWVTEIERAATTASSLEAEQDSGSGLRWQDTILGDVELKLVIYVSLILQFWQTASSSTYENEEIKLTATIDGRVKSVNKATIRRHLKLEDSKGISNLPNTKTFEQLALMRALSIDLNPFDAHLNVDFDGLRFQFGKCALFDFHEIKTKRKEEQFIECVPSFLNQDVDKRFTFKEFSENVVDIVDGRYFFDIDMSFLDIITKKVVTNFDVFGSGALHQVFAKVNRAFVVVHDRDVIESNVIVVKSLFHL